MPRYKRPTRHDRFGNPDVIDLIARHILAVRRQARRPNRIGEGMAAGRSDTGGSLVVVGRLGNERRGHQVNRLDGSTAFAAYDDPDGNGFVGIYDQAGQYIITDDAQRLGLARPYIPIILGPVVAPLSGDGKMPHTTNADWTTLWTGNVPLQNPVIYGALNLEVAAGATAEVRLTLGGVQIGSTIVASAGWSFPQAGPAASGAQPDQYATFQTMNIEGRVTAGSGAVGVGMFSLYGVESAWLPV